MAKSYESDFATFVAPQNGRLRAVEGNQSDLLLRRVHKTLRQPGPALFWYRPAECERNEGTEKEQDLVVLQILEYYEQAYLSTNLNTAAVKDRFPGAFVLWRSSRFLLFASCTSGQQLCSAEKHMNTKTERKREIYIPR